MCAVLCVQSYVCSQSYVYTCNPMSILEILCVYSYMCTPIRALLTILRLLILRTSCLILKHPQRPLMGLSKSLSPLSLSLSPPIVLPSSDITHHVDWLSTLLWRVGGVDIVATVATSQVSVTVTVGTDLHLRQVVGSPHKGIPKS